MITLGYNSGIMDACDATPWGSDQGSNVVTSIDTTIFRTTTGSMKLAIASGATTGLLAHNNLCGNLSLSTTIAMWIYPTIAVPANALNLSPDGDTNINIPALTANVWNRVVLTIANPSLITAGAHLYLYQAVDIGACSIYLDDIRKFVTRDFATSSVKGIQTPERVQKKMITYNSIDFSVNNVYLANRRNPQIDFQPLSDMIDLLFMHNWYEASDKSLFYDSDEVLVENESQGTSSFGEPSVEIAQYEAEYANGFELAKEFTLNFVERTPWKAILPASWHT